MSTQNPKLANVRAAYEAMSKDGVSIKLKGEPAIPNMAESHVQGWLLMGTISYSLTTMRAIHGLHHRVHFRCGSGINIVSETELEFSAMQRNFIGDAFYIDTFSPQD